MFVCAVKRGVFTEKRAAHGKGGRTWTDQFQNAGDLPADDTDFRCEFAAPSGQPDCRRDSSAVFRRPRMRRRVRFRASRRRRGRIRERIRRLVRRAEKRLRHAETPRRRLRRGRGTCSRRRPRTCASSGKFRRSSRTVPGWRRLPGRTSPPAGSRGGWISRYLPVFRRSRSELAAVFGEVFLRRTGRI